MLNCDIYIIVVCTQIIVLLQNLNINILIFNGYQYNESLLKVYFTVKYINFI